MRGDLLPRRLTDETNEFADFILASLLAGDATDHHRRIGANHISELLELLVQGGLSEARHVFLMLLEPQVGFVERLVAGNALQIIGKRFYRRIIEYVDVRVRRHVPSIVGPPVTASNDRNRARLDCFD